MLALRYVYVLALVVWLGGMVVLGAIAASLALGALAFKVLPAPGQVSTRA